MLNTEGRRLHQLLHKNNKIVLHHAFNKLRGRLRYIHLKDTTLLLYISARGTRLIVVLSLAFGMIQ